MGGSLRRRRASPLFLFTPLVVFVVYEITHTNLTPFTYFINAHGVPIAYIFVQNAGSYFSHILLLLVAHGDVAPSTMRNYSRRRSLIHYIVLLARGPGCLVPSVCVYMLVMLVVLFSRCVGYMTLHTRWLILSIFIFLVTHIHR